MKLQYGKTYMTKSGRTVGPLKVNHQRSANYPYLDIATGAEYDESGLPFRKGQSWWIIAEIDCGDLLPHSVDTVTISRKDYDRFIEMEKFVKMIATEGGEWLRKNNPTSAS